MGAITSLTDDTSKGGIDWAYNAISGKKTEVVNISSDNKQGVLVINIATTAGGSPTFNVHAGINADDLAPLLDSDGNAIEFTVTTTNKIFHLANCYATFIQLVFIANGTTSGAITDIQIIAK